MKKTDLYSLISPLKEFTQKYIERFPLGDSVKVSEPIDIAWISNLINHSTSDSFWITQTLSELLGIPWINLDDFEPKGMPVGVLSENLLRQYPVLPLWQHDKRLYFGVANPFENLSAIIRFTLSDLLLWC